MQSCFGCFCYLKILIKFLPFEIVQGLAIFCFSFLFFFFKVNVCYVSQILYCSIIRGKGFYVLCLMVERFGWGRYLQTLSHLLIPDLIADICTQEAPKIVSFKIVMVFAGGFFNHCFSKAALLADRHR